MEIIIKEKTKLIDLKPGKLFIHNGTIALKSEYNTENGAMEAFIVGTGEMFWGGTKTPEEQRNLEVFELEILPDIIEMHVKKWKYTDKYPCPKCNEKLAPPNYICAHCNIKLKLKMVF